MALTEEQQRLNEEAIQNTIDEWSQNQMSDKIKGLAEKNESFKGMTSPGRIDAQIESGVDFFDDVEGGARGFTPKTDLESLYNQAQNTTFGPVEGEVDYYADLNPPSVSTIFQPLPNEGGYLVSPPFPSPSTIEFNGPLTTLNIGNNVFDGTLRIPGANGSNFMATPILNQPTSFSNPSDSLTLTVAKPDQPIENFNNDLRIPDANGSDFMVTPILNQPTSFSNPSDSLTLRIQKPNLPIEEFSNDIRIPNANNSVDSLSKLELSNNFGIPGDRQPSISSEGHPLGDVLDGTVTIVPLENNLDLYSTLKYPYPLSEGANLRDYGTDFESTWPAAAPSNVRRRGPYDHFLASPFKNVTTIPIFDESDPPQITDPSRYFNEAETGDDSKLMGSIHISPDGEIKFGHRNNPNFIPSYSGNLGTDVIDKVDSKWPTAAPTRVTDRLKSYDGRITDATSQMVIDTDTILTSWPDAASTSKSSPTPYGITDSSLEYLSGESDENNPPNIFGGALETLIDNIEDLKTGYDDLFDYEESSFGLSGEYTNVPIGLGTDNLFGEGNFRTIANKGPFKGNNNHPIILREVGNNWGIDPPEGGGTGLGAALGGVVRGAPGITGLIDRNLTDKIRLSKYIFRTNQGFAFLAKQFTLQLLNPDKGTAIFNPFSPLGLSGVNNILGEVRSIISDPAAILSADGAGAAIGGIAESIAGSVFQLAASAALPIGHPERHLGGYRYEKNEEFKITDFTEEDGETGLGRLSQTALSLQTFDQFSGFERSEFPIFGPVIDAVNIVFDAEERKKFSKFSKGNPNRYSILNLISSAPQTIEDGVPSFTGGPLLLMSDIPKITSKKGGNFNAETADPGVIKTSHGLKLEYQSLSYDQIPRSGANTPKHPNYYEMAGHAVELTRNDSAVITKSGKVDPDKGGVRSKKILDIKDKKQWDDAKRVVKHTGETFGVRNPMSFANEASNDDAPGKPIVGFLEKKVLGRVDTLNVDRINILPMFQADKNQIPQLSQPGENVKDFIKFMFKDVVNKKYLVFRAILESISDTVTPEFTDTRFIGRPDKVYTYAGTDRNISFGFKIYPKTKQELPVLMEKLNYLIGLCYPSYTSQQRMITPFVELTLGDMFVRAPGILDSLTVTVEDATTWEIEEGLQFPHFISCQCEFKYIGKEDNTPVGLGKHYDIPWLSGNNRVGGVPEGAPIGTIANTADGDKLPIVQRPDSFKYISQLELATSKLNPVTE